MLSTSSRTAIARLTSAVACAVFLSTSLHPADARVLAASTSLTPSTKVIANVKTAQGDLVRFTALPDGSVGVDAETPPGAAQTSVLGRETFSSPVDIFRAVAPGQAVPQALVQANFRLELRGGATGTKPSPTLRTEHAMNPAHGISPDVDSWFIQDYCNVHSSYSVCYALPNYSWAYLSDSSVYYGHAVTYADNAPLLFTVNPVGQWWVPTHYTWSAWHYQSCWYGCNFSFYGAVNYAQYFDFEADIDY